MMTATRERPRRRLRVGGLLRRESKKRAVSLDETLKSLNSLALSEASGPDSLEKATCSQKQGALSKATSVLFRRRVATDDVTDDEEIKARSIRVLQEQKTPPLQPEPKDTPQTRAVSKETRPHVKSPPMTTNQQNDPAIRARREAIRAQQKLLGKHHPDVLFSLECLVRYHRDRGEHNEALVVYEEKQRLSRESYWSRSERIVMAHE